MVYSITSQPDETARDLESMEMWSVRVIHTGEGNLFGAVHLESPRRLRYVSITLEYSYQGLARTVLYPDAIVLVCIGSSPLQGMARSPILFYDEEEKLIVRPDEQPFALEIEAGTLHRATFVYEFHQTCREFRLYFPGQDGILIEPGQDG
jgi:hypothetical protein